MIIVFFISLVGLVVLPFTIYFWIIYFQTICCPLCHLRIGKDPRLASVWCPKCGAVLSDEAVCADDFLDCSRPLECARCINPLSTAKSIFMWDGEHYCRRCVEEISPDLLRAALASDAISDQLPFRIAAKFALVWVGPGGILVCGLFCGLPILVNGVRGVLPAILLFSCPVLPILMAYGSSYWLSFLLRRRTAVMVRKGRLVAATCTSLAICSLHACKWRIGRVHESFGIHRAIPIPCETPVVLLFLPETAGVKLKEGGHERVLAVGFTLESRQLWTDFLTLAGVEWDSGCLSEAHE